MQPQTYIIFFIFAGLAWVGLALLGTALFVACRRIFRPAPKPTRWEKDWESIERNLNQ